MGLRVAAALLAALALAAPAHAADWATFGFDSQRTGENPAERALGPGNAGALQEVWSTPLDGVINTQPLVAQGVRLSDGRRASLVIVGTEHGQLAALDEASGTPVWRRRLGSRLARCTDFPGRRYGITSTPVVDRARGRVYSADGQGKVHALDLRTGNEERGWPVAVTRAPDREHIWGALALRRDRLYAATSSHCSETFYRGRLVAIDAARAERSATWFPLPPTRRGGGMWGWGGASLDAAGDVYVATSATQAAPVTSPYAQRVARLSPRLRLRASHRPDVPAELDADFGATPMLFRAPGCPPQLSVVHKNGALFLYDRDRIGSGPRQTVQIGDGAKLGAYGTYAYSRAARTLFVANNTTGDFTHGLLAFRVAPDCTLQLAWAEPVGPEPAYLSPPVVANGVVYLGTGFGRELHAFDAATGAALWTSPRLGGAIYAAPTVVNGRLFVGAWDGRVHAYGLNG